jgi:serine/threonine protein kinase
VIDRHKNLKLIDYATCLIVDESKRPARLKVRLPQHNSDDQTFVGTPLYVSPEMLETSKASYPADIWAIGCIIYEVLEFLYFQFYYGRPAFDAQTEEIIFELI